MIILRRYCDPRFDLHPGLTFWRICVCSMAINGFTLWGCTSMHAPMAGTSIGQSIGIPVWVDKAVASDHVMLVTDMGPVQTHQHEAESYGGGESTSIRIDQASEEGLSTGPTHVPTHVPVESDSLQSEGLLLYVPVSSDSDHSPFVAYQYGSGGQYSIEQTRQAYDNQMINQFSPLDPNPGSAEGQLFRGMGEYSPIDDGSQDPGGPGGPDGGPPPGFGGPNDDPGYSTTWYPSASVNGQNGDLAIIRQRAGIDIPLWFKDKDAVMMSIAVDEAHFSGNAILPDTQQAFPSDLWNVQVGLKHMHEYDNGWTSMLMLDIGSASDQPFHSLRELNVQLGGFVMIPAKNQRDMWMVGAIYSPLGQPNFPIPLLSYHWKASDTFEMSIGLPCSLTWKPIDRLTIDVSYFPIMNVNALATYELSEHWSLYGGYQNVSNSWYLADRVKRTDQFVEIEQRLILGLKRELSDKFSVDVSTGDAFSRYFGVGNGMGNSQSDLTDRVNLQSGVFQSGRLTWNF